MTKEEAKKVVDMIADPAAQVGTCSMMDTDHVKRIIDMIDDPIPPIQVHPIELPSDSKCPCEGSCPFKRWNWNEPIYNGTSTGGDGEGNETRLL